MARGFKLKKREDRYKDMNTNKNKIKEIINKSHKKVVNGELAEVRKQIIDLFNKTGVSAFEATYILELAKIDIFNSCVKAGLSKCNIKMFMEDIDKCVNETFENEN